MEKQTYQERETKVVQQQSVTLPPDLKGDFARGQRTISLTSERPDYARGQESKAQPIEGPDFARGMRTQSPHPEGPDYARGMHQTGQ